MNYLPSKYLYGSLIEKLNGLQYNTSDETVYPRVEVSDMEMVPGPGKDQGEYVCTFNVCVTTDTLLQTEALNMLENISTAMASVTVPHFAVNVVMPDQCWQAKEIIETEIFYKQFQKYRIYLTQNN